MKTLWPVRYTVKDVATEITHLTFRPDDPPFITDGRYQYEGFEYNRSKIPHVGVPITSNRGTDYPTLG